MIEFAVLASGSKANCCYLSDGNTRLLVDCGLSAKQIALRLEEIGIEPDSIDGILISHEHEDHVRGARVFIKRHGCRIYCNRPTLARAKQLAEVPRENIDFFDTGMPFSLGTLNIDNFSIDHDAADPVAFCISKEDKKISIVTDLGQATSLMYAKIRDSNALVLETNHDHQLLVDAPYPWELKQRIKSRKGHLSNESAKDIINRLSESKDCRVEVAIAAHISENSNTEELALTALREGWDTSKSTPEFIAGSVKHSSGLMYLR
jgi:phosphoribosyl 1,2-cyclic phosphodiesterase